jgi:DNA mismatch endonuclease, patch repair protein
MRMADTLTPAARSRLMSAVRGHGNRSTELRLIAAFCLAGITGWRRRRSLPGKPDFVFREERVAIFVDGCFWHGCPSHYRSPKSRRTFWATKVTRNRIRDQQVNRLLRTAGWNVIRIWEHQLKPSHIQRVVSRIRRVLNRAPVRPKAPSLKKLPPSPQRMPRKTKRRTSPW